MLLLSAEQEAANGRAGFKSVNANCSLLVIGFFVASQKHPNPIDLKLWRITVVLRCSLSNGSENTFKLKLNGVAIYFFTFIFYNAIP